MMKMTVGNKLFAGTGAMLLITLLTGGVAIHNVGTLGDGMQELGHHSANLLYLSGDLNNLTTDMLATTRAIVIRSFMKDPEKMRKYNAHYGEDLVKAKREVAEILEQTRSSQVHDIAQNQISEKLEIVAQENTAVFDFMMKGDMEHGLALYTEKLLPLAIAISDSGDALAQLQHKIVADRADDQIAVVPPARYLSIVMICMSITVGIVVILVVRGINSTLRENIAELRDGAQQVASAASQVSSSSQSLAQGASEQAASLQETSASSEEINSMARKNTDNSRATAELLTQSNAKVSLANKYLSDMEVSMAAISDSSVKISRIIKVIDEIAFQTNILALNAAVEAARAGEAGMGFAVVADEVRSLAQRSAQAAKDTAELIEDSIAKSAEGKEKVEQVGAAIRAVTEDSVRVKVMVDEVSLGSEEQSKGIGQIGRAIVQMEQVTQTTAANAEEGAAAAEQLSAQSETMREVVDRLQAMVDGGPQEQTSLRQRPTQQRISAHSKPHQIPLHRTQPSIIKKVQESSTTTGFPMEESFQSF